MGGIINQGGFQPTKVKTDRHGNLWWQSTWEE